MDAPTPGCERTRSFLRLAVLGWLLLAASLLALHAKPVHAQETPAQTLDASLVKTVGTTPGVCAPEGSTYIDVAPGDTVYICYTLTNTGSLPLEPLDLIDNYNDPSNSQAVAWDKPPGFVLESGARLEPTAANGLIRAVTVNATITSNAGWGVAAADGSQTRQIASNDVTINVVSLGMNATLTGLASQITIPASQCTSPSVTLSSYQSPVYLCVTLTNASSITLTHHHVSIPGFNIDFELDKPLGPSGTTSSTIRITNVDNVKMAPQLSAPSMTSRAYITSTNAAASLDVSAVTEPVVVNGPPASVQLQKMLNTVADPCGSATTMNNVSYGQTFYYCLILINSASLTFTDHVFTEPALNIAGSFNAELRPGGRITVTNNTLTGWNVTPFLGPFTATTSINNNMVYTASNPSLGYRAVYTASASVSVLTPTPTTTGAPTPTNTPIPVDTPIASPTFTPIPATPTPTWTWTPSRTPTPPPTVLIFSTPGGAAPTPYPTLAGMPLGAQASAQTNPPANAPANAFVSPLDPFGGTATAQAQFAFPTPVLDPFGATATAQAQFAFPTPILDPFGATATAQAQFAFPTPIIDPFGATATAQAQSAFTSPLFDPLAATATADAQLALSAPLPDALAATATAQTGDFVATALAQAATVTAAVGQSALSTPADVAVAPPGLYITITATFTPEPPAGPTQRPLEEPTPGPTVDARSFFVRVLDSAGATVALLWFLGGSVLFFITAGVLAGLSFRAKEQARFALEPAEAEPPFTVQPEGGAQETPNNGAPPDGAKADDHWPDSLP